jgi:hypothetical protein
MKLLENIRQIILEASKKKILIDKLNFSEKAAETLDELCGPLSVWMGNKVIDYLNTNMRNMLTPLEMENMLKEKYEVPLYIRQRIQSIMDWIRVGLNGNVQPYKNNTFNELYSLSKQWHDSLEVGEGQINYVEDHDVILDFRDKNGNGLYWVDLNTNNSPEECERMGHCGRSSYGYLYSLRQYVPLNDKFKINKSLLTAAIGDDNVLYQLKGPKNSKPSDKYHQYIVPLFSVMDGEDGYLIQKFGSEYGAQQDFKISDLPDETIKQLYQERPDLFESKSMQRVLAKMGLIELPPLPTNFTLKLDPDYIKYYVNGGWENRYRNRNGDVRTVHIFEEIMVAPWDLWGYDNDVDTSSFFSYTIDKETENKLWDIVRQMAQKNNIELDEDLDLKDSIKEVDGDYEIMNAIRSAINSADGDDYVDHMQSLLKSALEEYGNVSRFDDGGVEIEVDLSNLVDVDDESVMDIFDEHFYPYSSSYENTGGYNLDGVLDTLMEQDYIEKPTFDYDDRWYPSPDDDIVNELVRERLSEIDI